MKEVVVGSGPVAVTLVVFVEKPENLRNFCGASISPIYFREIRNFYFHVEYRIQNIEKLGVE